MIPPSKQWQTKDWGKTRHLYRDRNVSVAEVLGIARSASSLHVHHHKHNTFAVLAGLIEVWARSGLIGCVRAGEALLVPAGVRHRMVFMQDTLLHEFYQALPGKTLDLGDIERLDPGWKPGERSFCTRVDFRGHSAEDLPPCGMG